MTDQTAILVERIVGIGIILGALAIPALIVFTFRRRFAGHPGIATLAVLAALMVSASGLIFGVCAYPGPPGVGAVPRAAKRRADSVAATLEAYRSRHGRYPSRLEDLASVRKTDTVLSQFWAVVGSPLEYRTDSVGGSFRIEFSYGPPGLNRCYRTHLESAWHCSGLF